jgi:thiamine biosynthesis lipoprotein
MLGTFVEIRVEGLSDAAALQAINSAFAEVATVHRLMSFHEADSDLARLHRTRAGTCVRVDTRTREVLECVLQIAAVSSGIFDPTVAAQQVARGYLPRPDSPFTPEPNASWRDIEFVDHDGVRLRRPLWLDLGGIAKGYAVDRAIDILRASGTAQACVNAGGDLRIFGARAEPVQVRIDRSGTQQRLVELANAAFATSARERHDDDVRSSMSHLHGVTRVAVDSAKTVSVIAERCMIADALTKVVLAGDAAITRNTLAAFAAHACVHDPALGWNIMDRAA